MDREYGKRYKDLAPGSNLALRSDLSDAITVCARLRGLLRDDEDKHYLADRAWRQLRWLEEALDAEDK